MLTTQATTSFKAGDGGDGRVSFHKRQKGPDGGNGADGGSIYLVATSDIYALGTLFKSEKIKAENGEPGGPNNRSGKTGKDKKVALPLGTIVTDLETDETFEILDISERILLCKGGKGGKGNWEFRSSTNTTPRYAEKGEKGQERKVFVNLKLIADYGFIGFPNAGKSSLLHALTNANPKIGSYPFTTHEANLGERDGKIFADIPGLIEGASEGKGLGIQFLKHVERVSVLLHCISSESENVKKDYKTIRKELEEYNPKLLTIPEIILLTKKDLLTSAKIKTRLNTLKKFNPNALAVSIEDKEALNTLIKLLNR